jgi:hypothetical protein
MSNSIQKIPFSINSEDPSLIGDKISCDKSSPVLLLHGAGTSTRKLFDPLRKELTKHKISTAAFDFIGHGDTGGCLEASSLAHRFQQACNVIEGLELSQPLSVIAASMGAYIAIRLLEKYEIANLILFVPAVYHQEAFAVPFNQEFSSIIRKPKSWLYSDAWEILQQFRGNLLIVFAEHDQVVPFEIIHKLHESAYRAKSRHMHLIKGAPHKILAFLANNSAELRFISNLINDLTKFSGASI